MTVAILITIVILVCIIIALMAYNISIHKKITKFSNISEKINGLNVLQNFMDTIGEYSSVEEKIEKINEIILNKYNILKYSTIVVFNGAEYELKASNVDEKHWQTLTKLGDEDIFKDSIATATPKYITVEKESEKLPYQKMEFGRAKSAMFFPLYIDNVYIGYWLIESSEIHAFDNIVTILKTVQYQNTVENTVRTDLFTGLNSAEYLYGLGKKEVDKYTISTVCMFRITNIEEINEKISRHLGNKVITQVSKFFENNISKDYLFVRYMGPKFVIVFSGVQSEDVANFLEDIKAQIEEMQIHPDLDDKAIANVKNKEAIYVSPRLNFVLTSYYKGTSMDGLTKKLEEYIDNADKSESDINYI